MSSNENQQLQKLSSQSLEQLRTASNLGREVISKEDIVVPRIALAQFTTQLVKDQVIRAGSLYNTLTEETYEVGGKPAIEFIVISMAKNRIKWFEEMSKGIEHRSMDGIKSTDGYDCETACPFVDSNGISAYNWTEDPKTKKAVPPLCTPYFNYISLISPYDSQLPLAISMGGTSFATGKKLATMMLASGGSSFSRKYVLSSKAEKNQSGDYFVFQVRPVGKVSDEELQKAAMMHQFVAGRTITIDPEKAEDEPIPF